MQTLANLRLLAELMADGEFEGGTLDGNPNLELVMGRILDNGNKKMGLELERVVKTRIRAEKKAEKEAEKEEAARVKAEKKAAKEEAARIKAEERGAREEARRRALEESMQLHRLRVERYQRQREYDEIIASNNYVEFARFEHRLIMEGARDEFLRMMRATERRLLTERLPKTETKRERREKLKTARKDGIKECGVCYNSKLCVLNYKCEHSFCKDCLVSWTKGCPICRSS